MRLFDCLRINREALAMYRAAAEQGKDHGECCDVVCEAMHEKYGVSLDWAKILEIILMILAMLKKPTTAIVLAVLMLWGATASAQQTAPSILAPPPPIEQSAALPAGAVCGPGGCSVPSVGGGSGPRQVLSRLRVLPRGRSCGPGGCGRGILRRR